MLENKFLRFWAVDHVFVFIRSYLKTMKALILERIFFFLINDFSLSDEKQRNCAANRILQDCVEWSRQSFGFEIEEWTCVGF